MQKLKYQHIIDDFITQINSGELEPGAKLPSQRALAESYRVNRSTVVESLDILRSYGILYGVPGKGVFVSQNNWSSYIKNNISWQNYIGNSVSKNNQYFIQKINEMEFDANIIRLSTGELSPDLIPNETFKEIIHTDDKNQLTTNYEEPKGNIQLREAIVSHLKNRGINCTPEEICVTSGALQGLKLIADGILVPQSKIIVETPSYINSVRTWHSIRAQIKPLPISSVKRNINNIFKGNSDYQNSIFYCIPSLHNPIQNTYSIEEKQKIINQCKRQGVPIVEDDIYGELWFDGEPPPPMKALKNSENVVYIGSLSKTVSPGLRVGWIVGNEKVVSHLADLKMQNDYGASSISQFIAEKWLKDDAYHEQHLHQLKGELETRRDIMVEALEQYLSDVGSWQTPQGSFYIWFTFNEKINTRRLFNMALEEDLLINPGEIYSEEEKSSLRFSYSYIDKDDIDESIRKLRGVIDHMKNSGSPAELKKTKMKRSSP